jgi:stage V sporulation protein B
MKPQSFLRGTFILLGAGIITKALGALFIIPLTRLIGAEGVGLLQMASPIFVTALVLCASGIPVATAKLVSARIATGDEPGARQVVLACLWVMIPIGLLLSYALYAGAGFITAFVVRDPRVFFPLRYLSPAILFVACSAVFRGYFQGRRIMAPTAICHVIEQVVRVVVGLGLAYALLPRGVHWSAAGAAMGGSCGSGVGLLLLVTCFVAMGRKNSTREGGRKLKARAMQSQGRLSPFSTLKELVYLAWPVTIASLVGPVQEFLNAAIIPSRLQLIGFSISGSAELYGRLSGMALGLVALPGVVTGAMAVNLLPQVAAAHAKGQRYRIVQLAKSSVRGALLVGIPSSIGLLTLPVEISTLIFGDPAAGIPLRIMAFGAAFLCLQQTTASVLNGVGKVGLPARNGLIGASCATLANYILTGIPGVDIRGAALGIGLGFLITGILNMIAIGRLTGAGFGILKVGWRAIVGSAMMFPVVQGVNGLLLMRTLNCAISTSAAILAGVVAYGLALLFLGEFSLREMAIIPIIGNVLVRVFQFIGWAH